MLSGTVDDLRYDKTNLRTKKALKNTTLLCLAQGNIDARCNATLFIQHI